MLLRKNFVLCADMWPKPRWTPDGEGSNNNPLRRDPKADGLEEDLRIQVALPTFGSALKAPGIPIEDYADFLELLTKPETITESPGAQDWDSIFKGLSNVKSVEAPNPSHRLQFEDSSSTSTALAQSNLAPPQQETGSKEDKPHQEFFKDIIADSMQVSAVGNSSNTEFERLRSTASSLAATALAPTTSDRYGRAWGRFKAFCSKNNFDPMSATGPVVATWLVCRAEETTSPNVLESDLKSIKCFRLAAKAPIEDFYIAEATLTGCQKKMEAKPRLRLGLEPEVVQMLIRKALTEHGHHNFVGIRQAAIYALMYYLTARFEEVRVLEMRQISTKGASLEVKIFKGEEESEEKAPAMCYSSHLF